MSDLVNTISLVMGDWSGDGHSQRDTIVIKSNLDKKAMEKAYKKATKILGFDFCQDVCADYEDRQMSKDKVDLLIQNGLKLEDAGLMEYDIKQFEETEELGLWIDSFPEIYLFIVKLGNPEFEYKHLEGKLDPSIHIGGYGLYE